MAAHEPATEALGTSARGRDIGGNAGIVSIPPRARIVESLRAVGLHVELRIVGRYVVPIVTKVAS